MLQGWGRPWEAQLRPHVSWGAAVLLAISPPCGLQQICSSFVTDGRATWGRGSLPPAKVPRNCSQVFPRVPSGTGGVLNPTPAVGDGQRLRSAKSLTEVVLLLSPCMGKDLDWSDFNSHSITVACLLPAFPSWTGSGACCSQPS